MARVTRSGGAPRNEARVPRKSAIPLARRAEFLAEVGAVLASSLDYDETLRRVARSAVPRVATWCVVDLLEPDGSIRVVAVAHADPGKERMVRALRERYPFDPTAPHGLPWVLRTGRPARYEAVQDAWRQAAARDAEHLRLMRLLDARSTVCAPLLAHGRVLGAITLVTSEPGLSYRVSDLRFVEELASRAALAIENARLYREARRAQKTAETARAEAETANARLRAIQVVTDAALAHLPMDALLRELLLRLRDLLRVDTVAVMLPADDGTGFVLRAALGLDEGLGAPGARPWGEEVAAHIAAQAEPLIVHDLATSSVNSPLLRQAGVQSLLGAPLLVEGRVLGVLHVGSATSRRFDGEDAHLLRLVADRMALAINQSQLYEAERDARHRAERLASEQEDFFANASHDLRTPVATIKASIEVLLQHEPPGTVPVLHQLLLNINREADRMTTLVADLLELLRLRSGHTPLPRLPCDLRVVATQARDAILPLTDQRRQHLELDLPTAPVRAVANPERLERALVNLLANAQKYGREGGRIRIGLVADPGEAVFSVADDGPGIPLADRDRLFERYYRADTAATRREQGSGLGLPIVRATAERHDGRAWAEETPGGGATFKLAIPLPGQSSTDQNEASR
jgi:signal transduction histidine kinase